MTSFDATLFTLNYVRLVFGSTADSLGFNDAYRRIAVAASARYHTLLHLRAWVQTGTW
ncbi:MAG: hypothetical protein ACREA0_02420 [bacterium]